MEVDILINIALVKPYAMKSYMKHEKPYTPPYLKKYKSIC